MYLFGIFDKPLPAYGDYIAKIGENSLDFYAEGSAWPEIKRVSDEHSFFHWDLEFADIFHDADGRRKKNPGFDAVVGNPPWDILKSDVEEFFAPLYGQRNQDKFRQLTKMEKNRFVKTCLQDEKISNAWQLYNENFHRQVSYFNNDKYHYQTSVINGKKHASDHNLYKLFLERSYGVLKNNGLCGLVIPSGIYSDLGTRGLRQLLFEKTRVRSLYSFINKKGIFEGIHRQFKFCLLVFAVGGSTEKFLTRFYMEDVAELSADKAFELDLELVRSASPNSWSVIECKNKIVAQIFKKMYRHPRLGSSEWNIQTLREFDMTNDSNLFNSRKSDLPLYEGKMIYQFSNNLDAPKYYVQKKIGFEHLLGKENKRVKKELKKAGTLTSIKPQLDCQRYRLVWRDVTNAVDRRTLIATILPPSVFLGNTLSYIRPAVFDKNDYVDSLSHKELAYLCGMLNSFPIDFILRHRVNLHVSMFHLLELPVPKFDEDDELHKQVYISAAKLVCTSKEYDELRKSVDVDKGVENAEERTKLQALINVAACKIYGLDKSELKFILRYFSVEDADLKKSTLKEFN